MIEINISEYVLEVLESKFRVIDQCWRNEILPLVIARITEVSGDVIGVS